MQDLDSNLADIMDATPRRRVEFDLSRVDIGKLTLLELLDASDAAGIGYDEFAEALGSESRQARLFYALAWVIMRRVDPSISYANACEFDLIVMGEIDEDEAKRTQERAKKVIAVAAVAGVEPAVAGQMSMAEVQASVELQERRNRAIRRKVRRSA